MSPFGPDPVLVYYVTDILLGSLMFTHVYSHRLGVVNLSTHGRVGTGAD